MRIFNGGPPASVGWKKLTDTDGMVLVYPGTLGFTKGLVSSWSQGKNGMKLLNWKIGK